MEIGNLSGKKLWITVGALMAAMVLCIGGIVGTAVVVAANQPTNVMLGAVQKLIAAKNVKVTGTISLAGEAEDEYVNINLTNAEQSGIATAVAAEVGYAMGGSEMEMSFEEAFVADGVLYFKVEGVAEEIDGQWWSVSLDDILDQMGDYLTKTQQKELKNVYDCVLGEADQLMSKREKYANLYESYPFVVANRLETHGQTAAGEQYTNYKVQLNAERLAGYYNEAVKMTDVSGINACLEESELTASLSGVYEPTTVDVATMESAVAQMPAVTVGVTDGGHELAKVGFNYASDYGGTATVDLQFGYPAQSGVSAPEGAKPATELYQAVMEIYQTLAGAYGTN